MYKTCATCGTLTKVTYCDQHQPKDNRLKDRKAAGYNYTWAKISRRARRLQPFCSDCGTTKDLTADHTPEAWERKAKGLPIRLQDIDVVCRSCNSKRGAARGAKKRSKDFIKSNFRTLLAVDETSLEANTTRGDDPLRPDATARRYGSGSITSESFSDGGGVHGGA